MLYDNVYAWRDLRGGLRRAMPIPIEAYGIEVELEGVERYYDEECDEYRWPDPPIGWDVKGDGSLRDGGAEFITRPLGFSDARDAIRRLWRRRENEAWTGGPRCGVHVHINMNARTIEQIATGLMLYAATEPAWFDLCGPDREENIYCVPWYRDVAQLDTVIDVLRKNDGFDRPCKYTAMYVEPLIRFGTVEFRGAPVFSSEADMNRLLSMARGLWRYSGFATLEDTARRLESDDGLRELLRHAGFSGNTERVLDEMHRLDTITNAASFVRTELELDWSF